MTDSPYTPKRRERRQQARRAHNLRFLEPEAVIGFTIATAKGAANLNADNRLALTIAADWLAHHRRSRTAHCVICNCVIALPEPGSVPFEIVVMTPFDPGDAHKVLSHCGALCGPCFDKPLAQKQAEAVRELSAAMGVELQALVAGKA
jgi:hypothetical protein